METEVEERITVTITRSKWARAEMCEDTSSADRRDWRRFRLGTKAVSYVEALANEDTPSLLTPSDCMCCLGFVCKALLGSVPELPSRPHQTLLLTADMPRILLARVLQGPTVESPDSLSAWWSKAAAALSALVEVPALAEFGPLRSAGGWASVTDGDRQYLSDRVRNTRLAKEASMLNDMGNVLYPGFSPEELRKIEADREGELIKMFAPFGIDLIFED